MFRPVYSPYSIHAPAAATESSDEDGWVWALVSIVGLFLLAVAYFLCTRSSKKYRELHFIEPIEHPVKKAPTDNTVEFGV